MKIESLAELTVQGLSEFEIVEMAEVLRSDAEGRNSSTVGFFKSEAVAKAFVGVQTDAPWFSTKKAFVLTNGEVGFVIRDETPVKLFVDEAEVLKIRQKIAAKLSPEELAVLGLKVG